MESNQSKMKTILQIVWNAISAIVELLSGTTL